MVALRRRLAAVGSFSLYALRRFNNDGCFAASGALSYTTLVSLVPLGVIALGILSIFPNFVDLRQTLLGFLFRNFVPTIGEQAAWWFQYLAGSAAQATAIGIIGISATGILLLMTVEDHLNVLWRVTVRRTWGQRILAYWTLMTLGPLLIGSSLTLSTYFEIAARRAGFDTEALVHAANDWHPFTKMLPFLLEMVACTLLYCIIPNCAVRWRDGLLGATIAAVAIELLKIGFSVYIGAMSSYQTVYGTLAGIPIFLLWMYVSWMAVLLGAVVAANLPTWKVDERLSHLSAGGVRLGFSMALIAALAQAQRRGGATCRTSTLARDLGVPTSVVDEHLKELARAGFVVPTQTGAWVLAWDPEVATLHDLYRALNLPLAGSWIERPLTPWQHQVAPAMDRIVKAEQAAMQVTLARLLAELQAPGARRVRDQTQTIRAIADRSASE